MENENNINVEDQGVTEVHVVTESNGITTGVKIIEYFQDEQCLEILGHRLDGNYKSFEEFEAHIKRIGQLEMENELYKHRLEVANEFIESRKEAMIPEHYDDLKYIINECDLESTW